MTIYTTLETFGSTVFQIMGDREIEVGYSAKIIVILLTSNSPGQLLDPYRVIFTAYGGGGVKRPAHEANH